MCKRKVIHAFKRLNLNSSSFIYWFNKNYTSANKQTTVINVGHDARFGIILLL